MEQSDFSYFLTDGTLVFTDTLTPSTPYAARKPRDHESLFFVTKGTLLYEKDGSRALVRKGEVGYIARGSIDKSSAHACDSVSYVAFNFRHSKEPTPTLPFSTCCAVNHTSEYERLFTTALDVFLRRSPGYRIVCNGLLLQIIGMLIREQALGNETIKKADCLENAMSYLRSHYSSPELTVADLARASHFSEKHLRRLFLAVYGKTPSRFIQEFRIDKAKALLLHSPKSITEVALACGFADVYSFSHCFKRHAAISPLAYRSAENGDK